MNTTELKHRIIKAGRIAVEHLIEVAEEKIITGNLEDDLSADKLKNAAASKKLAIFDAFEILARINSEEDALNSVKNGETEKGGFAERRAKR
jgi:hypothetical protein